MTMHTSVTLRSLLRGRGAWLDERNDAADPGEAARARLTRQIALDYPAFHQVRRALAGERAGLSAAAAALSRHLEDEGLVVVTEDGWIAEADGAARRYLSGGWLEELVFLAVEAAGADEAVCGQRIHWRNGDHLGVNEVDVLARFGDRLAFYSCKSRAPVFDGASPAARERTMAALHEADNLPDHFGRPGDMAVLVLATDLLDEAGRSRYAQLHGKARALEVRLLGLEDLEWSRLVRHVAP